MTYEQALEFIHGRLRFGVKPGLAQTRKLAELLGNPQDKLKFIHIAGTNGKGSTTAMLASVLRRAGYKTGMYISPFVLCFEERMQVDGEMIPREELAEIVEEVKAACEKIERYGGYPTEFEVVTATALCWFARRGCDVVCLEVGLGGRLDATNIIAPPLASVITSISLDHTAILGDTFEKIAAEKCGIIKKGSDTVCYPEQPPEALAVIMQTAAEKQNRLFMGNMNAVEVLEQTPFETRFRYGDLEITLPLAGEHQIRNCLNVLETLFLLRQKGYALPDEVIREGIAAVRFPARQELMRKEPYVIVDGGHNPDGAATLAVTMKKLTCRRIGVMGMLADKDCEGAVSQIAPLCDEMFTAMPDCHRALPAQEMADIAGKWCSKVTACDSVEEACDRAIEAAGKDGAVFICGSFYLASDARAYLLGQESTDKRQ